MEEQKFLEKEIGHLEKQLESDKEQSRPVNQSINKNKLILPAAIIIATVLISGSLIYIRGGFKRGANVGGQQQATGNQPVPGAKVDVSADNDSFLGNEKAKVTVIEFSDFQCPSCRSFWRDSLPQLKKEYIDTSKIKFVYRDYPLDFHAGAKSAAEGTQCARDQSKFWELHDKIFQEQDKQGQGTIQFTKADVVKWASQIGLNMTQFNQCLNSSKYKAEVEKDIADGSAAGVLGTPTTFINGRSLVGAQPYSSFKAVIDEELSKK